MQVRNVTVGYSRLVTGDNFSNKRYSCELTAELRDGDHFETIRSDLERQCVNYVESKIAGQEIIVVTKEQAEKLKAILKASFELNNADELPF